MNNMVDPSLKKNPPPYFKKSRKAYLSYSELSSTFINIFSLAPPCCSDKMSSIHSPLPHLPPQPPQRLCIRSFPKDLPSEKKGNIELPVRSFSLTADQNVSEGTQQGVHVHLAVL